MNSPNQKSSEKTKIIIKKTNKGDKGPEGNSIVSYIVSVLIMFIVLSALYSFVSGKTEKKAENIPISELAADIKSGVVKNIIVKGDVLLVEYTSGDEKTSKKETDVALSQTLVNYSVTKEQLALISINIKEESSLSYWLMNLAPIIFPILFIFVFIWFISRQVKGAGIQALTFGQSKARMIDPNDKNSRVTFKDVAGCKEAKEELAEIVDFLRNPKSF